MDNQVSQLYPTRSLYSKLLSYLYLLLLPLVLLFVFSKNSYGFEEPPYLPVTKPNGNVYILCPTGDTDPDCDYFTLEEADGNIGSGNTLQIKAGSYAGNNWHESGSPGNEIVIETYNNGAVYIEGETIISGENIIIDGGTSKNIVFRKGSLLSSARLLRLSNHNITLSRVQVVGPTGLCDQTDNTGILIKGYSGPNYFTPVGIRIYNCLFLDCNHKSIYVSALQNGEIRNNIIKGTGNTGLQINPHEANCQVNGLVVSGNALYDNGNCLGMEGHNLYIQATTQGEGLQDVTIKNNLFWNSHQSGIHIASIGTNMLLGDLRVYNNTFYNNTNYGLSFDNSVPGDKVIVVNNIFYGNGAGATQFRGETLKQENNNLTSDPLFQSTTVASSAFLKISETSPAKNTGANLSSEGIVVDYYNCDRPQDGVYDIGAHEYLISNNFPWNSILPSIMSGKNK